MSCINFQGSSNALGLIIFTPEKWPKAIFSFFFFTLSALYMIRETSLFSQNLQLKSDSLIYFNIKLFYLLTNNRFCILKTKGRGNSIFGLPREQNSYNLPGGNPH